MEIPTIENGKNIVLDLNGKELTISHTITNNGTFEIKNDDNENEGTLISTSSSDSIKNNGTFTVSSGKIKGTSLIRNKGITNINGGVVEARIYNDSGTITVTGGKIDAGSVAIDGKGTININGGIVKSTMDALCPSGGTTNITNGEIYGSSRGIYLSAGVTVNISGGTITGKTDGLRIYNSSPQINMTGGVLEGQTGVGAHIQYGTLNVSGGKIKGKTHGVYSYSGGIINIGKNDGDIDAETPEIIGEQYGIFKGGGTINFYDGILKGKTGGYNTAFNSIAPNAMIIDDTDTIDDEVYQTSYLLPEVEFIELNGTGYKKLSEALLHINSGDIINITEDGQINENITISSDKEFTIKMNGHSLVIGKEMVNNGNLTITDLVDSSSTISSKLSSYLITNNSGATLTIDNVKLSAPYVIKNNAGGTFNGDGTTITSTNTAINNIGSMNLDNYSISGSTYGVYDTSTSNSEISNSSINIIYKNSASTIILENDTISEYVYNNANGVLNFSDSTITRNAPGYDYYTVYNNGTMTFNNTDISLNTTSKIGGNVNSLNKTIENRGTMELNNRSTINNIFSNDRNIKSVGIYNYGTLTVIDSDIILSGNTHHANYPSYGIFSEGGNATIKSGNIKVDGISTYGIYIKTGTVTLGEATLSSSPTYGEGNADVSVTNPLIESYGTTSGIGVKNENNNGTFNFYDGKVIARHSTLPEDPTGLEYFYENKEFVDSETGYNYSILKWMRETGNQPDSP